MIATDTPRVVQDGRQESNLDELEFKELYKLFYRSSLFFNVQSVELPDR